MLFSGAPYCLFFKQKTAYEMRIRDWSSDVCSSDLLPDVRDSAGDFGIAQAAAFGAALPIRGISGDQHAATIRQRPLRPEERRVGQACASPCRSRWMPDN